MEEDVRGKKTIILRPDIGGDRFNYVSSPPDHRGGVAFDYYLSDKGYSILIYDNFAKGARWFDNRADEYIDLENCKESNFKER